jgi:hypothetical protein
VCAGRPTDGGYRLPVTPTIDELTVADVPGAWSALGLEVDGDTCVVGDVRIRLAGLDAGKGLIGWSLRGIARTELDGLLTTRSDRQPPSGRAAHSNGVIALDHVVAVTPALDRTVAVWGLAFVAPDLDATVAGLGDRVSEIRPAIQPGRRIATLRRSAGLAVPVALITPARRRP